MPDEEVHTFELLLTVLRPLGIDVALAGHRTEDFSTRRKHPPNCGVN